MAVTVVTDYNESYRVGTLVVICFHFTIFVVLETTMFLLSPPEASCDLLSFYYLCRTGNNKALLQLIPLRVVICFHFTIFVVLETTTLAAAGTIAAL